MTVSFNHIPKGRFGQTGLFNAISQQHKEEGIKGIKNHFKSDYKLEQNMQVKLRYLEHIERFSNVASEVSDIAVSALTDIQGNLNSMKTLVQQATDEGMSQQDRDAIRQEINNLNSRITQIAEEAIYGGVGILDSGKQKEQTDDPMIARLLEKMSTNVTARGLGTDKVDVSDSEAAKNSLKIIEEALKTVEKELIRYKYYKTNFSEALSQEDLFDIFNEGNNNSASLYTKIVGVGSLQDTGQAAGMLFSALT